MSRSALFLCLLLVLASSGKIRRGCAASSGAPEGWDDPSISSLRERGTRFYRQFEFLNASRFYEDGYRSAMKHGFRVTASRFLINRAGCRFFLSQYQSAIQDYLEAVRLAGAEGEVEKAVSFLNLSSLYLALGDRISAEQSVKRGLITALTGKAVGYRPQLLVQLARIRSKDDPHGSAGLLREAISESDRTGDAITTTAALDSLGTLHTGVLLDPDRSEAAFTEAFRMRKTLRLPDLEYSYLNLAKLREIQGGFTAALHLVDAGLALRGSSRSLNPIWNLWYRRGTVHLAQGRIEEAFDDFGQALDFVRRWREDLPAVDALRLSTDVDVHFVFQALIETGNRLAIGTGDTQLARRTFAVAEEHRAASLQSRWKLNKDWRNNLSPSYWELLSKVRTAEAASLKNTSQQAQERLRTLRLSLVEMEAQAGRPPASEGSNGADVSRRLQGSLGPSEALLAFEAGDAASWLWALSAERLRLFRLPAKKELADAVRAFRASVQADSGEALAKGRRLYATLFGQLDLHFEDKQDWILVLDDALFEAPFAALVTSRDAEPPVYLVQRHSLRVLPTAVALLDAGPVEKGSGLFVGVADPVYNRADARWKARTGYPAFLSWTRWSGPFASVGADAIELPRLPESAREIRACAEGWPGRLLLEGEAATQERIEQAIAGKPDVLHLATHILHREQRKDEAFIALSLGASGRMDMLTPSAIAPLGATGLVVLSGCGSGQGEAVEGAGLLGLTRAWLAGGAKAVVATHWPIGDEAGELLRAFYSELRTRGAGRSGTGRGVALQHAQQRALALGGARSRPSYWARYFVVGKE